MIKKNSTLGGLFTMMNLLQIIKDEDIDTYYIDLFAGAGGTSTGVELATDENGKKIARVIMCVNHDKNAIASHFANHPHAIHATEDIRTLDLSLMVSLVKKIRMMKPNAVIVLWASLECTNFSKAKGGLSRNPDSRTLAEHLYRYIDAIKPDLIQIENVEEFLDYGPVELVIKQTKKGYEYCPLEKVKRPETEEEATRRKTRKRRKFQRYQYLPVYKPIKELKATYYNEWRERIKSYGYEYGHRILNAADYGAYTSRKRVFIQFAKPEIPIAWPVKTHSKKGSRDLFDTTLKYNAVKECLDFSDEGESIFDRKKRKKKPLVENTLDRILSGCIIHVAGGRDKWLLKYNSVNGKTNKHIPPGIDEPCPVVCAQSRLGVVQASFITKHFSGHPDSKSKSIEEPAGTITTVDHHSLITSKFLAAYYGNGFTSSIESPCPVIPTKDRFAYVNPKFLMNNYTGGGHHSDIENPCPAITQVPKQNLVQCHFIDQQFGQSKPAGINKPLGALTQNPKYALVNCEKWLMNTNFNNIGSSLDDPAPTITANRKWHYLMDAQYSRVEHSIERPCFTLIARMDKTPPYLIEASAENRDDLPSFIKIYDDVIVYEIYKNDTPKMKEIKEFMAIYGLTDIKMRMLLIPELKVIMGFPKDYILIGSQEEQKKYIGNAVEVTQAKVLCVAFVKELRETRLKAA